MKVGIPSEIALGEQRVGATPKTVVRLIKKQGFDVYIQSGAGSNSNYSDEEYVSSGATILDSAQDIYEKTDIILKVKTCIVSVIQYLV